jgi:3-oxoacyl-[acyl-carrier protein] reductase
MKKYALITGGTKGIGKAVACILAKAGYDLLLSYATDEAVAHQTCKELEEFSSEVHIIQADNTQREAIDKICHYMEKKRITLDTVIMNAGLTCRDSFDDIQLNDWERVFFANVHFPVFLLQRLVGRMNRGGSVVFTGSLMGIHPHSVSLVYGVTKSAVHALVKNLVKFLAPYGIRINAVAPGFVDTEWQKTKSTEIRNNIEGKIASGRFCHPDELADVYRVLIENNYLNGEIIVVDGGYAYK